MNLSVTSENEEIATATIKDEYIYVKTHKKGGKVIIKISDSTSKNKQDLIVYVKSIEGAWKYLEQGPLVTSFDIDINDDEIKGIIRKELEPYAYSKLSTVLGISLTYGTVEIIPPNSDKLIGSLIFNYPELTITYQNTSHKYTVQLGSSIMQMTEDLTTIYKEKYPNHEVNKVSVTQYLHYISY